MKKNIFFLLLSIPTISWSQHTISSINSGAYTTTNLFYSVGEVYVIPDTDPNQANSGLIGVLSRIEFFVTGTENILLSDDIQVFPNPTSRILYIESTLLPLENQFQIFDEMGRFVTTLNCVDHRVDLSSLTCGTYFIKSTKGKSSSVKIIKQ